MWGKYGLNTRNNIEREEESKYKKEKMIKCNNKIESSEEIKRKGKSWRKWNNKCGLIGKRRVFYLFFYFFLNWENKSVERENKR